MKSKWLFDSVSLAALMTGVGMYAFFGVMQDPISSYVRQFGYGDDWLVIAHPLAATAALVAGVRFRNHWWLKIVGLILLGIFFGQMRLGYIAASEAHGLAAGLGKFFTVILSYYAGISFLVCFVIAGAVLGAVMWRDVKRRPPEKLKLTDSSNNNPYERR